MHRKQDGTESRHQVTSISVRLRKPGGVCFNCVSVCVCVSGRVCVYY